MMTLNDEYELADRRHHGCGAWGRAVAVFQQITDDEASIAWVLGRWADDDHIELVVTATPPVGGNAEGVAWLADHSAAAWQVVVELREARDATEGPEAT